jgi:signal transduction histidine kinase/CheY-like chemotaxis protein
MAGWGIASVKIHVDLSQCGVKRSKLLIPIVFAAALLSGCTLSPEPEIRQLAEGKSAGGELITLPQDWPVRSFVQGTAVTIPFSAAGTSETLGMYFGPTTLAFRAAVNGRFVHETGDASSPAINYASYRARPRFHIPSELVTPGDNELTLQLFMPRGTTYAELGRIYLGDVDAIEALAFRRLLAFHIGPLAIGVMLLAVGLVAMGLWRGRRDSELFMLLASGSLLWALQIFLFQWPTRFLPPPHWSVFVNSLYAWFPALIGVFFLRFAYRRSRSLEWFAFALAIAAAPILYAGFRWDLAETAFTGLRLGVLVFISLALVAVLRYALQLRTWTGYTLFAMGAICVAVAIRDFVRSLSTDSYDELILNPYSGVALLLFAGWMLLERFHKAYADSEMVNRDLEHRVAAANVELHRRLEQVEAARAAAEQANVAKSRFFAAASHDLRQPLHSLGLFATALRDIVASEDGRTLVRRIGDSIDALDRLFDELLDLSRLDAGTVEAQRRNIALQPIFDRLDGIFAGDASAKGLRLRFVPTALAVNSDPVLLERVLANLVSNAIRYTQAGGVVVGARRRGAQIALQVCDTGLGIAEDQQELIFDEFYQVGNPGRDRRKGLGLGLAIVRRLTTLLGHPLSLRSEVERGTCFTLLMPRAVGPVESALPEGAPESRLEFAGGRALFVDDDADIRDATVRLLSNWGMETRAVGRLADALDELRGGFAPDVVLADLRLGDEVDGIGLIERLREFMGRPVAALLISGDIGARELARVRDSGLLLLTKPVAPAKLRSALYALLGPAGRGSL